MNKYSSTFSRMPEHLPANFRGGLWMLLASASFAIQSLSVKLAGEEVSSFQIVFMRCIFGLIIILPLMSDWNEIKTNTNPVSFLRVSSVTVLAIFCGMYAVANLPLATSAAISFTKPLFVFVLAIFLLGEIIDRHKTIALIIGFTGALIILRPGTDEFSFPMIMALLGAIFTADLAISMKRLSGKYTPIIIMFYISVWTILFSFIPGIIYWQSASVFAFFLMFNVALMGNLATYFTIRAFRIADATAVIPYDYCRLLFATILGFIVFQDIPDLLTIIGIIILIAGTYYLATAQMKKD